jgi:hypothetical protein
VSLHAVITTINAPSATVQALAERCPDRVIVIGDTKTPADWSAPGTKFYSLDAQRDLGFVLAPHLRTAHYARKNLGYLLAMRAGAECIYDTDDDNVPLAAWMERQLACGAQLTTAPGWRNVYSYFHESDIWPRGFGLSRLADETPELIGVVTSAEYPVQQGLADGEPDVDAIWRMAAVPLRMRGRVVLFREPKSVALGQGVWCPFNSQTTWWFPEAQPLLYLPSYATFRMTDIWRSFVAQRCLWEIGRGVVFHSPSEVMQKRNEHDLMKDFEDEVPGYLANEKIAAVLEGLSLRPGIGAITDNLMACYETLVGRFLPVDELHTVRAWVRDVERIKTGES